jgi:hypothetical protein
LITNRFRHDIASVSSERPEIAGSAGCLVLISDRQHNPFRLYRVHSCPLDRNSLPDAIFNTAI